MQLPNSPLAVLADLVGEYREGTRTQEELLSALDSFDTFIDQWAEGVLAVTSENEEDSYKAAVLDMVHVLGDGVACVREGALTGNPQLLEQGLTMAGEAQQGLVELMIATHERLEQLEDELA